MPAEFNFNTSRRAKERSRSKSKQQDLDYDFNQFTNSDNFENLERHDSQEELMKKSALDFEKSSLLDKLIKEYNLESAFQQAKEEIDKKKQQMEDEFKGRVKLKRESCQWIPQQ